MMARSRCVAYFERKGVILPGCQAEIADYLANRDDRDITPGVDGGGTTVQGGDLA